ncbi:MAG: hypothetical protein L6407_02105 [Candidatus Delongbacteria bacterium]|nr:hypothetical protein [Candidatus Delongbacteria bacterium]
MKNFKLNNIHYIIMNYLSVIFMTLVFQFMKDIEWTWLFFTTEVFFLTIFIISFYFAYYKTKAWIFVHSSLDKLNEKESKIVGNTSKQSYVIFTIVVLLILLLLSVTEFRINIVFTVALIYFAHILPASIIVFKNRIEGTKEESDNDK